jgi:hypothetical protein
MDNLDFDFEVWNRHYFPMNITFQLPNSPALLHWIKNQVATFRVSFHIEPSHFGILDRSNRPIFEFWTVQSSQISFVDGEISYVWWFLGAHMNIH